MKENVTADPVYVRFFGANGVMFDTQMPADAIKELWAKMRLQRWRATRWHRVKIVAAWQSGTSAKSR